MRIFKLQAPLEFPKSMGIKENIMKKKTTKVSNRVKKPLIIILLGPPGSGKGTQAKLLQKKFNLEYIGSGEMIRERQKVNDFTGKKLLVVSWKKGELAPTFLISKLWIDELEKSKNNPKFKGFILDGSPRKIIEALFLDEAIKWYEWQKNVKIFLVNISKKESIWRLTKRRTCQDCGRIVPYLGELKNLKKCDQCGGKLMARKDQSPKATKKRLEEFEKETKPAINYYKKQGRLIKINGEQSIENIFKDILKVIQ